MLCNRQARNSLRTSVFTVTTPLFSVGDVYLAAVSKVRFDATWFALNADLFSCLFDYVNTLFCFSLFLFHSLCSLFY